MRTTSTARRQTRHAEYRRALSTVDDVSMAIASFSFDVQEVLRKIDGPSGSYRTTYTNQHFDRESDVLVYLEHLGIIFSHRVPGDGTYWRRVPKVNG